MLVSLFFTYKQTTKKKMQVYMRSFTSTVKFLLGWRKGFLHCPKQPGLEAELLGNFSAKEHSLPLVQWKVNQRWVYTSTFPTWSFLVGPSK